ncbi:MAG TPA: CARDB domain-containing protein, partial [Thermodesulfovibrionales bacterium]|nr:CARDB domain-containing protein [Thermodesulfovibrionales bacterium]
WNWTNLFIKNDGTLWKLGGPGNGPGYSGSYSGVATQCPLSNVAAVSGGINHALIQTSDGNLYEWAGAANPMPVTGLPVGPSIISFSMRGTHAAVLMSDGSVWSWDDGTNQTDNQLGNASITESRTPVQSAFSPGVVSCTKGYYIVTVPLDRNQIINSISATDSGSGITYLISRDNGSSWHKWDQSSWIQTQLSADAVGMSSAEFANIPREQLNSYLQGKGSFEIAIIMNPTEGVTPYVTRIAINYIEQLTVIKSGTGGGTVTSSETPIPSINCGTTCNALYSPDEIVTLTALAEARSAFAGWSGGGCSGTGTCIVAMNTNQMVTASFAHLAPSPPQNFRTTPLDSNVVLNWSANTEPDLTGYNIYRKSGQSWIKLSSSLSLNTSYTDTNLKNGTYTYRVTAADSSNSESQPSNEATAQISVAVSLSRPEIFFPTTAGFPEILSTAIVDIAGLAEPSSSVELFGNGSYLGKTAALERDTFLSFPIGSGISSPTLSPDGKVFVYMKDGAIWSRDISADTVTQIIQKGLSPLWSPDGRKIAYVFRDTYGYYRLGVYDMESAAVEQLTNDVSVTESNPSWSWDGTKVAFLSNKGGSNNVWIKDVISGSFSQVTNGFSPSNPKLSPDGNKVAYLKYQTYYNLYVKDLIGGETTLVDSKADLYSLDWSPDSKKLAFASNANGNNDIYVADMATKVRTQITNSANSESSPSWSPDGGNIIFTRQENSGTKSILIKAADATGQERVLQQGVNSLTYLAWTESGAIAYINQTTLNIVYPEGYFSFKSVQLNPGENIFYAVATDSSGNASQPSDPISVIFDSSLMPDLEIDADDIFIYPPYPKPGEQVAITVTIKNNGGSEARNVEADIYLMDSTGSLRPLHSETIPVIAAGSEDTIGLTWAGSSTAGVNNIIVTVDSNNTITEFDESNNYAMKEIVVVADEKIIMTTTLDSDNYQAGRYLSIDVNIKNPGVERTAALSTFIEDGRGTVVTALNAVNVDLP